MPEYMIRAVVFKEGEWWVAQCLEHDIATQNRRLEDLPTELHRLLSVQITASRRRGIEPFQGFSPAPRRFWDMYAQASPLGNPVSSGELPPGARIETRVAA